MCIFIYVKARKKKPLGVYGLVNLRTKGFKLFSVVLQVLFGLVNL